MLHRQEQKAVSFETAFCFNHLLFLMSMPVKHDDNLVPFAVVLRAESIVGESLNNSLLTRPCDRLIGASAFVERTSVGKARFLCCLWLSGSSPKHDNDLLTRHIRFRTESAIVKALDYTFFSCPGNGIQGRTSQVFRVFKRKSGTLGAG